MTKIFINYRREDSGFAADRVHEAAVRHVGDPSNVFMDIDGIPPGVDFVEHIREQVGQCDVMFVLIGRDWLDVRDSETGQRRLDDPGDYVRAEISAALKRGIYVVPLLLGGAAMPRAASLPDDIKALATRNAVDVGRASFDMDVAKLMSGLGIDEGAGIRKKKAGWGMIATAVALVLAGGATVAGVALYPQIQSMVSGSGEAAGKNPAGEVRTRRLGLSVYQNGNAVGVEPVQDDLGIVTRNIVPLEREPFEIHVSGTHWDGAADAWPRIALVLSDDPGLLDIVDPGRALEASSPFHWACIYASYPFGSPELLIGRRGNGPNGVPICGMHHFDQQQVRIEDDGTRVIEVRSIGRPDRAEALNLIDDADKVYAIVYITDRAEDADFETHIMSVSELEFLELDFQ